MTTNTSSDSSSSAPADSFRPGFYLTEDDRVCYMPAPNIVYLPDDQQDPGQALAAQVPLVADADGIYYYPPLPEGWTREMDEKTGTPYYLRGQDNTYTWDWPDSNGGSGVTDAPSTSTTAPAPTPSPTLANAPSSSKNSGISTKSAEPAETTSPLPPGWTEEIDYKTGETYYLRASDNTYTWDRPICDTETTKEMQNAETKSPEAAKGDVAPLPPGWTEEIDDKTGSTYYLRTADNTYTWDRPTVDTAAAAAAEMTREAQEALESAPPPLPSGWVEEVDYKTGSTYFLRTADNTYTWDRPFVGSNGEIVVVSTKSERNKEQIALPQRDTIGDRQYSTALVNPVASQSLQQKNIEPVASQNLQTKDMEPPPVPTPILPVTGDPLPTSTKHVVTKSTAQNEDLKNFLLQQMAPSVTTLPRQHQQVAVPGDGGTKNADQTEDEPTAITVTCAEDGADGDTDSSDDSEDDSSGEDSSDSSDESSFGSIDEANLFELPTPPAAPSPTAMVPPAVPEPEPSEDNDNQDEQPKNPLDDSNYWPYEDSSDEEEEPPLPLPEGWVELTRCGMPYYLNKSLNVATYFRPTEETGKIQVPETSDAKENQLSSKSTSSAKDEASVTGKEISPTGKEASVDKTRCPTATKKEANCKQTTASHPEESGNTEARKSRTPLSTEELRGSIRLFLEGGGRLRDIVPAEYLGKHKKRGSPEKRSKRSSEREKERKSRSGTKTKGDKQGHRQKQSKSPRPTKQVSSSTTHDQAAIKSLKSSEKDKGPSSGAVTDHRERKKIVRTLSSKKKSTSRPKMNRTQSSRL